MRRLLPLVAALVGLAVGCGGASQAFSANDTAPCLRSRGFSVAVAPGTEPDITATLTMQPRRIGEGHDGAFVFLKSEEAAKAFRARLVGREETIRVRKNVVGSWADSWRPNEIRASERCLR